MRTMRWILAGALAVLISCGGGSSSTTSEASSTSTVAGTDALQGDGSSSTQISPVVDCNAADVSINPLTPTLWDAAGYCWGADRKVIVDIIIEMNQHLDPMHLQQNEIIILPKGNARDKTMGRAVVGDTGPGGGIIVYVDVAGFDNSSGDPTSIGAMCLKITCHYLEMAPTDLEGSYWWDEASVAAEAFSTSSANDWVLPSKDALNAMCKYAFGDMVNAICNDDGNGTFTNSVGGFSPDWYWSSSEVDNNFVWNQLFYTGRQVQSKNSTSIVRPVRAF